MCMIICVFFLSLFPFLSDSILIIGFESSLPLYSNFQGRDKKKTIFYKWTVRVTRHRWASRRARSPLRWRWPAATASSPSTVRSADTIWSNFCWLCRPPPPLRSPCPATRCGTPDWWWWRSPFDRRTSPSRPRCSRSRSRWSRLLLAASTCTPRAACTRSCRCRDEPECRRFSSVSARNRSHRLHMLKSFVWQ